MAETKTQPATDNGQVEEALEVPPSLPQKIAAVYAEITTVKQSGDNKHLKYQYSTDSDLYDVIRPLLIKHRLLLAPTVHAVDGDGQAATVTIHFKWIDIDDPQGFLVSSWVSAGMDRGGFAISKALTTGIRTYLAKFFQIPTGDIDPEADHGAEAGQVVPSSVEGELVDDIVSLARYLVDSNIWTKEKLKVEFIAAGAKDTSSSSAAAASMSTEDAEAFKKALEEAGK